MSIPFTGDFAIGKDQYQALKAKHIINSSGVVLTRATYRVITGSFPDTGLSRVCLRFDKDYPQTNEIQVFCQYIGILGVVVGERVIKVDRTVLFSAVSLPRLTLFVAKFKNWFKGVKV